MNRKFKVGDKVRRLDSHKTHWWHRICMQASRDIDGIFIVEELSNSPCVKLKGLLHAIDEQCLKLVEAVDKPVEVPEENDPKSALDVQVAGSHYDFPIQPIEFIHKNNLSFIQGNIIKYACRHDKKNGVEDLKKVIHYAQLEAKLKYGVDI